MLLALLLLSQSVKSRVNPACLRCLCSVHSPGPASVLKIDWVWQMGNQQQSWDWLPNGTEEEVIWWVVALNCTNEGNEWGPSEVIAVFFITKWTGWRIAKGRRQLLGKALLFVIYLCYSLTWMMVLQHRCVYQLDFSFNSIFFWPKNYSKLILEKYKERSCDPLRCTHRWNADSLWHSGVSL